ncbi:MAG: DUF5721 family protein [Lachnospiraceae bacterium]|nr:DUF5721 family protein [Lachnospiraceae bacterium]
MLSLQIKNVKQFMIDLLKSEYFDNFLLDEAYINTNASFYIDGTIQNGFYTDEDKEELSLSGLKKLPYSYLKNNCFELIKGKRTPVSFKFVFLLPKQTVDEIKKSTAISFDDASVTNMYFICSYNDGKLFLTDGISYQTFVPGHELDKALDNYLKTFLNKLQIDYDEAI